MDKSRPLIAAFSLPPPLALRIAGDGEAFFNHPRRGYHNYSLFIIHFSLFILQQNGGPMRAERSGGIGPYGAGRRAAGG